MSRLPDFFKSIFWDCDFSSLDLDKNKRTIVVRTLNHGEWKHWKWVVNFYGKEELKDFIINNIPESEIRKPALNLISLLLGINQMKYETRSDYIRHQKNI